MNLKGCLTKIGCFGQKADSSVFIVNCMSCNRLQSTRGFWLLIHLMYWLKQQLFGHTIIESHGWPIQKLDVNIAFYVFLFRETVCMSKNNRSNYVSKFHKFFVSPNKVPVHDIVDWVFCLDNWVFCFSLNIDWFY